MEPAVRSPWVEKFATITTKNTVSTAAEVWPPCDKKDVSRRAFSAGNGIFGCGDSGVEIAARDDVRPQRPKEPEIGSANPGTNGLSELDGKKPGSEGLGGGDQMDRDWMPATQSLSNESPVGARNGNFRCRDRATKSAILARIQQQRLRKPKNQGRMSLTSRPYCECLFHTTTTESGWWAHQGSNLGPTD
jgi:hypothetical protein